MGIRAYIDTNIIVYAVFHHTKYGSECEKILYDAQNGRIEAYGSYLVAIELLGSLSRIDPVIAYKVTKYYLALNIKMCELNELTLTIAGIINTIVNVRYDAIHLALMLSHDIDTIITNDLDDWIRIKRNYKRIRKALLEENYDIRVRELKVISSSTYKQVM
ncbi:MAG: type II toxin-antitoxin system VapC family toxin [Candidatus Njordarchaeales archaeon]